VDERPDPEPNPVSDSAADPSENFKAVAHRAAFRAFLVWYRTFYWLMYCIGAQCSDGRFKDPCPPSGHVLKEPFDAALTKRDAAAATPTQEILAGFKDIMSAMKWVCFRGVFSDSVGA